MKTNIHEGGIRSPLWMRWPGKFEAGHSSDQLAAHIDLMPTILAACQVDPPAGLQLDGRSLLPLLLGKKVDWPQRSIVIQTHRGDKPVRYHHFMIRDQNWKLLHASGFGREQFSGPPKFELYNLADDPREDNNLIDKKPKVFARLKKTYDAWFDDVSSTRPDNYAPPLIHVGTPHENPTVLTRQDWRGGSWAKDAIGYWDLHVVKATKYDIRLEFDPKATDGTALLKIGGVDAVQPITANANSCVFKNIQVPHGDHQLHAVLSHVGKRRGVYQVIVTCK
jgi:arylsulfatase/arylsulfatase A